MSPERPSRGCARCGSCCDPVSLDFGLWSRVTERARRYEAADFEDDPDWWRDHVFIAANMRPVGVHGGSRVSLECRFFDRAHGGCRAYERRPPMCSDYPWYGREPTAAQGLLSFSVSGSGACCSFVADLPPDKRPPGSRPLIPLTVL